MNRLILFGNRRFLAGRLFIQLRHILVQIGNLPDFCRQLLIFFCQLSYNLIDFQAPLLQFFIQPCNQFLKLSRLSLILFLQQGHLFFVTVDGFRNGSYITFQSLYLLLGFCGRHIPRSFQCQQMFGLTNRLHSCRNIIQISKKTLHFCRLRSIHGFQRIHRSQQILIFLGTLHAPIDKKQTHQAYD